MRKPLNDQQVLEPLPINRSATPFLKWAGGKSQLLTEIRSRLPRQFNRYFEPFLGGGAVFFDLAPKQAILSDANKDLINCYKVVRDQPAKLLKAISLMVRSEPEYYRWRKVEPGTLSKVEQAARLIYLNKTCFNGLYRVNKSGQFNVPYGKTGTGTIANESIISRASATLKNAEIISEDYKKLLTGDSQPLQGDFVYLDPPYLPIGKFSDFKRYTKNFFHEQDHVQLAQLCGLLDSRKCLFMLSNSFHPRITELYSRFRIEKVKANRFINCRGNGRGKINELIIRNY